MEFFNEYMYILINLIDRILLSILSFLIMFIGAGIFACTFNMGEDTIIKESEINEKDN